MSSHMVQEGDMQMILVCVNMQDRKYFLGLKDKLHLLK